MTRLLLSLGAGLALALAYAASPLGVLFALAAPLVCLVAGRGLPAQERNALAVVLGVALGARVLVIVAMFIGGIPTHSDLSVGALSGDEAYNLGRALRSRDILLGFGVTHYDYFVATDQYGYTSYLRLLTHLQLLFGPAPYGIRLFNALLFCSGAAVLFRLVRPAFGAIPAFGGLILVLALPSVFYASVSLLKESLYFLATSVLLFSVVRMLRPRSWVGFAIAAALAAASVWILDDLRRGAVVLAGAGIGCALVLRLLVGYRWRMAAAAAALAVAATAVVVQPAANRFVLDGLTSMARTHTGHVFTVGHAYKLLDEGFYMSPAAPQASSMQLTPPQAARYVVRAVGSFIATPLPWRLTSLGEFVYLPEHMVWYLLVALLPFGLVAGWRRDPLITAVLFGFVLPTAAALAFTNGNVGTLLRLRGLVTPYIAWISVLGFCVVANALASGAWPRRDVRAWRPAPEGTVA